MPPKAGKGVGTCRICGNSFGSKKHECKACGKIVCNECVVFEAKGTVCKKCYEEGKMPEIDWK